MALSSSIYELTLKQLHSRLPDMLRQECKGFDDEDDCIGSEGDPYSCSVVHDDDGPSSGDGAGAAGHVDYPIGVKAQEEALHHPITKLCM